MVVYLVSTGQTFVMPSLLATASGKPPVISDFEKNVFTGYATFEGNPGGWTFADFLMTYDPCTCAYGDGVVAIELKTVTNTTVNLRTETQGTIDPVANSNGNQQPNRSFSWRDAANKYTKSFTTFNEFTADYTKYVKNVTGSDASAITMIKNVLQNAPILRGGLEALPYVSAALKLFDIFVGTTSGPQQVTITPMVTKSTGTIQGNFTTESSYGGIIFSIPGSENNNVADEVYPMYNEVLGVVSLLRKPKIARRSMRAADIEDRGNRWIRDYYLAEPIEYVINPASGLYLQDIQAQLIDTNNDNDYPDVVSNVASCLSQVYRRSYGFSFNALRFRSSWRLSITFNLRRIDGGENVLMHYNYEVEEGEASVDPQVLATLDNCNPNLATDSRVQSFCQSAEYTNGRTLRNPNPTDGIAARTAISTNNKNSSLFRVKPNPANAQLYIDFEVKEEQTINIQIMDMFGRVVVEVLNEPLQKGIYQKEVTISHLPNGTYLCRILKGDEVLSRKIVVNH